MQYTKIAIPKELAKAIKRIIEKNKELGYRSVNEFCLAAIREKYEKLLKLNRSDHKQKK